MAVKKVIDGIKKYGDGHYIYGFFVIIVEKVIFKMPMKKVFDFGFLKKNYFERRKYLGNKEMRYLESLNCKDTGILGDKHKFDDFFCDFVKRDFLFVKDASFDEFKSFLKKHPVYMEKANWACEGFGISKKTVDEKTDYEELYNKYCNDYALLEEVLKQHHIMDKMNSSSVNTVRISTVYSHGKANIVAATLRIGVGGDTDNLHNGGICGAVDIETGIVKSLGYDKNNNVYIKHPVSDAIIPGFQIPNWDSVISLVKNAAEKIPEFVWIGWDVAITEESAALIEGNHNQDVDLIQFGSEGLKPKIKKILK